MKISVQLSNFTAERYYYRDAGGVNDMFYLLQKLKNADCDLQIPNQLFSVIIPMIASLYQHHFWPFIDKNAKALHNRLFVTRLIPELIPLIVSFLIPTHRLF